MLLFSVFTILILFVDVKTLLELLRLLLFYYFIILIFIIINYLIFLQFVFYFLQIILSV